MNTVSGVYVAGKLLPGSLPFEVRNPATGEVLALVQGANAEHAALAVNAAAQALPHWAATPAEERSHVLLKLARLLARHAKDLSRTVTLENGKPLAQAEGEIRQSRRSLQWFAGEAMRIRGEVMEQRPGEHLRLTLKQPVGVVGVITPWNFPLSIAVRKLAPILAAGATAVVKPAEQTPLSTLALIPLLQEAGLPDGVVNILAAKDPRPIGQALFADPRVRRVTFTGSTEVARTLVSLASPNLTRLSLELGGTAAFIVDESADLQAAAQGLLASKFRNAGQTCICANRVFVHASVAGEFGELMRELVLGLKVGPGLAPDSEVGPLIDESALAKVQAHVDDAKTHGARLLTGGGRAEATGGGHFFQPTLLSHVPCASLLMREETFGPVIPLCAVDSMDEALRLANDTPYGLAAYVYCRDLGRAMRYASALEAGVVGVNDPMPSVAHFPFGGVKQSGQGREGGREGIEEFLETKYVSLRA